MNYTKESNERSIRRSNPKQVKGGIQVDYRERENMMVGWILLATIGCSISYAIVDLMVPDKHASEVRVIDIN